MICVSIGRTRHKMVVREHQALAEDNAKLVELRLDWLNGTPDLTGLLKDRPTATIVTCRRAKDYGRWRGSEEQRMSILRAAIAAGVEYVDLEDDIAGSIPRFGSTQRIISHHNFVETPENLYEIHDAMAQLDPDIIKLITMANTPADAVRMLELVADSKIPTVGFCMGEFGVPSRILCGKYGAPFTYASFSSERELAPGQISYREMRDIYSYDTINAETEIYGVIGDPIGHSMSPLIHNAAFRHAEINAVYIPFRVSSHHLKETFARFRSIDLQGYSVTIPHKEAAVSLVRYSDEPVQTSGAANTLYQNEKKQWFATNTDLEAAIATIREGLRHDDGTEGRLEGKRVLVLGAGGVARGIGLGLIRSGCALTVTNRTRTRGEILAKELKCQYVPWESRGVEHMDILVNCTSIGMHPNVDGTPYPANWFREGSLAFDTVYNPENTLFLKEARERHCKAVSGVDMFVRQAAAQFECFTKQPAPIEIMREAFRDGISPLNSM